MRLISVFTNLSAILVLTGCLSIPTQQRVLVSDLVSHRPESTGQCFGEKIAPQVQKKGVIERPALDPTRISVLNWNIHKGRHKDWAADFKGYIEDHDIVTIQEAHLDDDLTSMLDKEHRYWALNTAFYYQDKATGVMTASKVKPVYNCGQHTVEPLSRLPKTSLISYYPIKGIDQNLLVANVHIINFAFGMDEYKEQIEKLEQAITKHAGPVVLAGDFNTWGDERMRIVDDLAERLSLESLDYASHNRTRIFGNVLDHVFYRGLEPVEHKTWSVLSSDHNPTSVIFRVN